MERELHAALMVAVATVVSVKRSPVPDAPNYAIGDAELVLSEVLKGTVVAGDKIRNKP